jgi:hypothetical protein
MNHVALTMNHVALTACRLVGCGDVAGLASFTGMSALLWNLALRGLPCCFTLGEAAFVAVGGSSVLCAAISTVRPTSHAVRQRAAYTPSRADKVAWAMHP